MTAYLAGLAILRCAEHERAEEIDPTARLVVSAMATFASERADPPEYFGSWESISARSGLTRSPVARALVRLERLKLIQRDGQTGKTVRWRIELLGGFKTPKGSEDTSLFGTPKNSLFGTPNPSETTESQTRDVEEGSSADAPTRSADAPLVAPALSIGEEVAAALGVSLPVAEQWVADRLNAATGPVRNIPAFIRACLARQSSKPARKTAGARLAGIAPKPAAKPHRININTRRK